MKLTGANLIGHKQSKQGSTFQSVDPKKNEELPHRYNEATNEDVDEAAVLAKKAFDQYRSLPGNSRATFLDEIAAILEANDDLLNIANQETALPMGRLQGERGRTCNQLRLFAKLIRKGDWVEARIDPALPDRKPLPRVDIRSMLLPIGPVAVFGASNFPLAFSVAGGDTASALAAGCPVVVKGHPSHPGTSEIAGQCILEAAKKCNMPEGVFSLLQGRSYQVGQLLVQHPDIQAVGFTGSFTGGKALFDLANNRAQPIPVFAEMGSTNPVFVLPDALAKNGGLIAEAYAKSITLGVGQFCTNPGLLFSQEQPQLDSFKKHLREQITAIAPGVMLNQGISQQFQQGITRLTEDKDIEVIAVGEGHVDNINLGQAHSFATTYDVFGGKESLSEELFGPSSLVISTKDKEELLSAASNMDGHLTATIYGTPNDLEEYAELIPILTKKVGRLIVNNMPTGVEVCDAMVHGGPYPATTAPATTSVGTAAIKRFVRPVCYQNFDSKWLPPALQDNNPLNIMRLVNGEYTREWI